MPDQKISQLTAIVTVDNSTDVLPIVDTSANTTKKVTPTQLKTSLALDNVDNTSDADKPVSIAQQDALNAKVSSNAAITAGTAPKITFDAKGLVTSGDSLDETDLPTGINANKIGTGVVSTTEFEYLNGVTSAIQTQIDSKQATLVSGTNIKTINSTSLLGSGDITIAANPSGVAGAIQFSDGSAFASDAANLFWDDTNNRLGIRTNSPTATTHIVGVDQLSTSTSLLVQDSVGANILRVHNSAVNSAVVMSSAKIANYDILSGDVLGNSSMRFVPTTGGIAVNKDYSNAASNTLVHIKGSGSTSATTSLLVQNSAGTAALTITDDRNATFGNIVNANSFRFGSVSELGGNCRVTTTNPANPQERLFSAEGNSSQALNPTTSFHDIRNFTPTSGSALFTSFQYSGTINQTGGANGITRGLYINPTLTAAADFRAIEATQGNVLIGNTASNTAKLSIKGSGSTSATTSLLVQNSAGSEAFKVTDDLVTTTGGTQFNIGSGSIAGSFSILNQGNVVTMGTGNNHDIGFNGFYSQRAPGGYRSSFQDTGASSSLVASALVSMTSTTRGFLPPRMTTTQKNAIATPASGLVVYDSTTNKLCCYNGSTWNDLF